MVQLKILERLFHAIPDESITFNRLCKSTKLHPKTIRHYIKIVEWVQAQKKINVEREDFRVIIRKKA